MNTFDCRCWEELRIKCHTPSTKGHLWTSEFRSSAHCQLRYSDRQTRRFHWIKRRIIKFTNRCWCFTDLDNTAMISIGRSIKNKGFFRCKNGDGTHENTRSNKPMDWDYSKEIHTAPTKISFGCLNMSTWVQTDIPLINQCFETSTAWSCAIKPRIKQN